MSKEKEQYQQLLVTRERKNKIKRPPNAFFLYRKLLCKSLLNSNGIQISHEAASRWAAESEETRSYFQKKAEILRKEHYQKYPEFKWFGSKGATQKSQSANHADQSIIPPRIKSKTDQTADMFSATFRSSTLSRTLPNRCFKRHKQQQSEEYPVIEILKTTGPNKRLISDSSAKRLKHSDFSVMNVSNLISH